MQFLALPHGQLPAVQVCSGIAPAAGEGLCNPWGHLPAASRCALLCWSGLPSVLTTDTHFTIHVAKGRLSLCLKSSWAEQGLGKMWNYAQEREGWTDGGSILNFFHSSGYRHMDAQTTCKMFFLCLCSLCRALALEKKLLCELLCFGGQVLLLGELL